MNVRLFSMPGSHAATTGELLFQQKGIEYKRTDLLPVVSWVVLKALRFPGVTVPAAKIDGERVQGTREIARALEARQPEPPLYPEDAERRRAVEEAERFGDEVLQQRVREIFLWSARKDRSGLVGYLEGAKIGLPHRLAASFEAEPRQCCRRSGLSISAPLVRRLGRSQISTRGERHERHLHL